MKDEHLGNPTSVQIWFNEDQTIDKFIPERLEKDDLELFSLGKAVLRFNGEPYRLSITHHEKGKGYLQYLPILETEAHKYKHLF